MPKIELSDSWGPEPSNPSTAHVFKQRPQALLRNPIMDLLQDVPDKVCIATAAKSSGASYTHVLGGY